MISPRSYPYVADSRSEALDCRAGCRMLQCRPIKEWFPVIEELSKCVEGLSAKISDLRRSL